MDACTNPDILRVIYFFLIIVDIVKIVIPIALIIMGIIDFSKAVVVSDEKVQKKSVSLFMKRLLYAVLVFLVPWIVEVLMITLGNLLSDEINFTDCLENANSECIEQLDGGSTFTACHVSENFGKKCYLCSEKVGAGNKYTYVWTNSSLEDNIFDKKNCLVIEEFDDKDNCIEQNNAISYCYYCDATEEYYYGTMPTDTCDSDSGWEPNYSKTEHNCNSSENNTTDGNSRCWVCSLGSNTMYKWGEKKPTDICLAASGWEIDYNISSPVYCMTQDILE